MNFKEFTEEIKIALKEKLNRDDICIYSETALKNNHTLLPGLLIEAAGSNIMYTIPLKEYYEELKEGVSIQKIAAEMAHFYQSIDSYEIAQLGNFDQLREKVIYRIVNREKNQVFLRSVPYMPYLDLAITFHVLIDNNASGCAALTISNRHLKYWGIDSSELYPLAHANTKRLFPSVINPFVDLIRFPEINSENEPFRSFLSSLKVLSNRDQSYGASCILYDNVLADLGKELQHNFYLLPYTVDEFLILPENRKYPREFLMEIVESVLNDAAEKEQFLSSHPYYYDRHTQELSCI